MRVYYHAKYWVKVGCKVSILTKPPNHPQGIVYPGYSNKWHSVEYVDGIDVHRIWSYIARYEGTIKRIMAAVSFAFNAWIQSYRIREIDIVIATSPTPFAALAGYMIALTKRVPFIFEVRDVWPETLQFLGRKQFTLLSQILTIIVAFLYKRATGIVCVAEGQKILIASRYGISESKISIIPNGADIAAFHPQGKREHWRKECGWENKFIILYAGNHGITYDLPFILNVAEKLKQKKDILFVLMGEGSEKSALKAQKEACNLDNVMFYDQQPKASLPLFYEAADLCFIPLRAGLTYEHSRPLKMYEAMAIGLPILLAGSGEAKLLIEQSHAGVVVPPGDIDAAARAVVQLVEQPGSFNISKNTSASVIAEHYTREKAAMHLLEILTNLCHTQKK